MRRGSVPPGDRLTALRASDSESIPQLDGIELHAESGQTACDLLAAVGVDAKIEIGDFFAFDPTGSYDAVIGNPPYVRYQDVTGSPEHGHVRPRSAQVYSAGRFTSRDVPTRPPGAT